MVDQFDNLDDFLASSPEDETVDHTPPIEVTPSPGLGTNLSLNGDMKPREFIKSIAAVYRELGGDAWLLLQARENPKEFLGMIKHILPKNIEMSMDHEINISIAARSDKVGTLIEGKIEEEVMQDFVRIN